MFSQWNENIELAYKSDKKIYMQPVFFSEKAPPEVDDDNIDTGMKLIFSCKRWPWP